MQRLWLIVLLVLPTTLLPQAPHRLVHGTVRDRAGVPVVGANVFVLGSTDGALTDSTGRFSFTTSPRRVYDLVVRRIEFEDGRFSVPDSLASDMSLVVSGAAASVSPVVVRASRYVAGDEKDATLTPLEVVTIPGTAADVNRAIQTLPGVQQVDDGNGLFVRGGDYTETRIFLDGAPLLTPAQLESSAGTFVRTLDPFLLDAVVFTAGGFGARYGDALSAIVELQPQRRPTESVATLSAGLASIGANVGWAGPRQTGVRLVADHNDLTPVVRINGSPRQFTTPPKGDDGTLSAEWDYRSSARVSVFATSQTSLTGAINTSPSVVDTFTTSTRDQALVARWSDLFGSRLASVTVSSSYADRSDDYGSFRLESPSRLTQAAASLESSFGAVTERMGIEGGWESVGADGTVPASGADQSRGARTRVYDITRTGWRMAAFDDYEWKPTLSTQLTAGLRHDRSTYSSTATYDPRMSAAIQWTPRVAVTAAWGYYHQTVDPLLQTLRADTTGGPLPAMRARQAIIGLQVWGDGLLRVEVYDKSYTALAGQTHDLVTVGGGVGRARGADMIVHAPSIEGVDARLVYSYSRSRRTDPSTGVQAPAATDIPHSLTLIATRSTPTGITIGSTFRYASGRPFTPVVSASRAAGDTVYTPTYGTPGSERLPAYVRLDVSGSWYHAVSPTIQAVVYVALSNVLNRGNVYARQYTADYSSFYDVRSVFSRSIYFGIVLTLGKRK